MEQVLPATLSVAREYKEIYTEIIKDSRNMEIYSMLVLQPKGQGKSGDFCPTSYIWDHTECQWKSLTKFLFCIE